MVESHDGIGLMATFWYDAAHNGQPRPVVLAAHGWAQDRSALEDPARWLVSEGYHVVAWDARGFGESGGTVGLNGPDEWADVSAIIDAIDGGDVLPGNVSVLRDDADAPRIGMVGSSYGGAIQLLAAAHDDRIDAIVPDITWNDLVNSLAPHGVVKRGWVDLLFGSGVLASHGLIGQPPAPNLGGMDERLTMWFLQAYLTGRLPDDAIEPLLERSPVSHLEGVRAHVLLSQGWHDTLFLPDEAVATYQALREREGTETRLILYPGGHGHPWREDDLAVYGGYVLGFLDHHLWGEVVEDPPAVIVHDATGDGWIHLDSWPPVEEHLAVSGLTGQDGSSRLTLTVTPAPTSQTDMQQFTGSLPPLQGDLLEGSPAASAARLDTGQQGPLVLQGNPRVVVTVTPDVGDLVLFFSLVEARGDDHRVLFNQVTPVRVEGPAGTNSQLEVVLPSLAHTLRGGSELLLRVTTSDTGYHGSRDAGTVDVHLEEAVLELPVESKGIRMNDPGGRQETGESPLPAALFLGVFFMGFWFITQGRKGRTV